MYLSRTASSSADLLVPLDAPCICLRSWAASILLKSSSVRIRSNTISSAFALFSSAVSFILTFPLDLEDLVVLLEVDDLILLSDRVRF